MIEIIAVVLLGAVLLLQVLLLVKSRDSSVPVGVMVQLDKLDHSSHELHLALNKLEGGLGTVTTQVQGIAQTTAGSLEPLREALDHKLSHVIAESRAGRGEIVAAFQGFEGKMEQRLATFDTSLAAINKLEGGLDAVAAQIQGVMQATAGGLEPMREAVEQKLAEVAAESRAGRGELVTAFQGFEGRLEQRLATFDVSLTNGRMELAEVLAGLRGELTKAVGYVAVESTKSREALMENAATFEQRIQERFMALTSANQQVLEALKADIGNQLAAMSVALREQLDGNGNQLSSQLSAIQESVALHMTGLAQNNLQNAEQLRGLLNERLAIIQADNTVKLDEIRRTVDEKLHATLEQRLGQSFQLVSDRLEQVQRGLGEMQALTAGVGDLKRVLANVKTTGTWGEVQLGAIIEQVLTPDQFARNVATRPASTEQADFALRLPGKLTDHPVWLPIDAKFPMDDYQRLLDAYERADEEAIKVSAAALEARIRAEAQALRDKCVCPPFTTDFAILYLPTEGLFAEVLRRPGLSEAMQREYRIVLSGPTTLAAILNSLQMGFKTLSIEKRSAEVWTLLGAVKTEFGKFGDVLVATQQKLEAATSQFSEVNVRTRAIQRKLSNVEELPTPELAMVLPMLEPQLAIAEEAEA
jgi:DNA recombination protein RmuC